MVSLILLSVPLLDVAWYAWALWRVKNLPGKKWWRAGLTAFFLLMITHFAWMLLHRRAQIGTGAPPLTLGMAYIWHLLVLPLTVVLILAGETLLGAARLTARSLKKNLPATPATPPDHASPSAPAPVSALTRRQFLTVGAVAAAPAFTILSGITGRMDSKTFRVRRIDVSLAHLPAELDGITITHLTDIHAGKFSDEKLLRRMVETSNELRSDLTLITGDLIDFSLSDLPNVTDAIARLDAPGGVHICEGNHDLFESREEFEGGLRRAHLGLLVNETANVRLNDYPVQVQGLRWGVPDNDVHRFRRDGGAEENLALMADQRDADAFPILLAHHPHAFDAATARGIPFTVSGHTHGGQFMLNDHTGAGSWMFKYWSGLYRQDDSAMVVSNGVGNWLPLRINAPAEIVQITLHRRPTGAV